MLIKHTLLCNVYYESNLTFEHLFRECSVASNFILDTKYSILGAQFIFLNKISFLGKIFTCIISKLFDVQPIIVYFLEKCKLTHTYQQFY